MTGGFRYDVDGIRAIAPGFGQAADSLESVLRDLDAARNAEGSCWGGDDAGAAFAAAYAPASEAADRLFASATTALRQIHTDLRASADAQQATDESAAGTFDGGMR